MTVVYLEAGGVQDAGWIWIRNHFIHFIPSFNIYLLSHFGYFLIFSDFSNPIIEEQLAPCSGASFMLFIYLLF